MTENKEHREKHLVYRAGLVPYYKDNNGTIYMMFMRPSDSEFGGFVYQLAKGKVEDEDETFYDAAIREACEELGLFKSNIIKTEEVGNFMGRTMVYVSKVKNKELFGQPSFETESTKWMTLEEFMDEGRELHRPVVSAVHRQILRMERDD
ncbi:MAG: NUDIX hydrolase [Hydrotalea sp. AMD]|uniref:NUDIX domain-containing protein n=1 Tax=Hydrotalea sp. AMD TaxID=2501297 RepID=UPI0010255187|nr:NUDIX hydrolase [Hydrotalea sp. AMD]RWZ87260.1 MAG: NUDIX hydrolase [Hydrotalea sp. AMD]